MTEDDTPEALEARCWALRERAERAESERDKAQDTADNEWLDAIGTCYQKLAGQPWETRDGETASEGRVSNIGALFRLIEESQGERDKALAAIKLLVEALEGVSKAWEETSNPDWKYIAPSVRIARNALAAVKGQP